MPKTFTVNVWLVRHGPTNANVMTFSDMLKQKYRKSIIDPVLTKEGLQLALCAGKSVYQIILNNPYTNIKYFTSLLPRTSITMLALLTGATIPLTNDLVKRINYIQEKENYGISTLNSKRADFASWKKHMSRFKQAEIVGSSAVTNVFKSNQYVKQINKMFDPDCQAINETDICTSNDDLRDEYELQIHNHNHLAKFLNLLIDMKNDGEYNENDTLFIVGHGDWIKDFLEEMIHRNCGVEKEKTTYSSYSDRKIKNCEGHLLQITLPINTSNNKRNYPNSLSVKIIDRVFNSNFEINRQTFTDEEEELIKRYCETYGFTTATPYGVYSFGDMVTIKDIDQELNSGNINDNARKFLTACRYMYYKSKIRRNNTLSANNKISYKAKQNEAKTELEWNNKLKFGGNKIKTFTKVIHGRKRKIYIGPKGGKYYIKKDKNNKNKKVYIN